MYGFIKQLCQPYTLLCLIALLGVANLWRKRLETRRRLLLATIPVTLLFLISCPAVSYLALGTLEWRYPPEPQRPVGAEAIVVLNAGISFANDVLPEAELEPDTLRRLMHAAKIYHQGPPCPILVTGGPEQGSNSGPSCAAVMRDALLQMGLPQSHILLEEKSQSTYENAVECRVILEQHGIKKIILVTDASHLSRASRCFFRQGIEVLPSGCRYGATELPVEPRQYLPNAAAAQDVVRVSYEWVGVLWYWWHGRI